MITRNTKSCNPPYGHEYNSCLVGGKPETSTAQIRQHHLVLRLLPVYHISVPKKQQCTQSLRLVLDELKVAYYQQTPDIHLVQST